MLGIFDNNATCSLCKPQLLIYLVLVEPCVLPSCSHLHLQHDEPTPTPSRSFGQCGHVHGAETGTSDTLAQLCCVGQGMRPGAAAVCRALSVPTDAHCSSNATELGPHQSLLTVDCRGNCIAETEGTFGEFSVELASS